MQALLIDYKNVVLKAQREVENGLAGFSRAASRSSTSEQAPRRPTAPSPSRRAVRARLARLHHGADRRAEPYQAQNNLAAAEGGVSVSLTTAYRALGGGWQIRDGHEFVTTPTREMRARTNYGDILPPAGQPQPQAPGPGFPARRPRADRAASAMVSDVRSAAMPRNHRERRRRASSPSRSVRRADEPQDGGDGPRRKRTLSACGGRRLGRPRQERPAAAARKIQAPAETRS